VVFHFTYRSSRKTKPAVSRREHATLFIVIYLKQGSFNAASRSMLTVRFRPACGTATTPRLNILSDMRLYLYRAPWCFETDELAVYNTVLTGRGRVYLGSASRLLALKAGTHCILRVLCIHLPHACE